jgi:hypothetical protein
VEHEGDLFRKAVVSKTRDGGTTWRVFFEREDAVLNSADFLSENEASIVLDEGGLLRTQDGGRTWITMPTPQGLTAVSFADSRNGVGEIWHGTQSTDLYYTDGGGKSWKISEFPKINDQAGTVSTNRKKE